METLSDTEYMPMMVLDMMRVICDIIFRMKRSGTWHRRHCALKIAPKIDPKIARKIAPKIDPKIAPTIAPKIVLKIAPKIAP